MLQLFHSTKPHPFLGAGREVRIFLHEKGVDVPLVELDIASGKSRRAEFLRKNPSGQLPALELEDGRVIAESVAICELFEDRHPAPALIGRTPEEKAETRMWQRRVEFGITENIVNGWRFGEGREWWKSRGRVLSEASDGLKAIARDKLAWLDGLMAGRRFIVGDRFTLADILLVVGLDFGAFVGQGLPPELSNLAAWKTRVDARASVVASGQP